MRLQHMISHLAYKRSGLSRAGRPGRPLPTLLQCRHYRLQADAPVPHCDNTTELAARHFRRDQATRDKCRRAAATFPVDRPHTTAAEPHHSVAAYPTCCTALGNAKTAKTGETARTNRFLCCLAVDRLSLTHLQPASAIRATVCCCIVLPQKLELSALTYQQLDTETHCL